jgi:hypothetical protein
MSTTTRPASFRKHTFSFSERWAVFQSHERVCLYCGDIVAWRDFEVDHIINESLLQQPDKLNALMKDYGLGDDFSVNGFQNWACSHHRCNRAKADRTFDKSRALYYLMIAEKKAKHAQRIYNSTEKADRVNKVLAPLRALIENGTISREELIDFANTIIRNAELGLNNPLVICFGLRMEDVYEDLPKDAPDSPPYTYDWLETELTKELQKQLGCRLTLLESARNGETVSVRYALWDLEFEKLNTLRLRWWEILELSLHTEIYGEFTQNGIQNGGHLA